MSTADLAPGNDQIYEEKQENFLTPGNPQDGQVILYKVGTAKPQRAITTILAARGCRTVSPVTAHLQPKIKKNPLQLASDKEIDCDDQKRADTAVIISPDHLHSLWRYE